MFPYHVINEEALTEPEPPPPENEEDMPELLMECPPEQVSAIVGAEPLPDRSRWPVPTVPDNVRNFRFWVRWLGKPHTQNSWEPYERVWHTHAFQEFVAGWPEAIGHVRPSAYAQRHRNHVNALLRGRNPRPEDARVLLPDAEHVAAVMEGYLPLVKPTPKGKELVRASQAEGRASQRSQDVAAQQSQEGAQLTSQPEDVDSEESEWLAELEGSGAALMLYADDITVPTRRGHLSVSRQEGSTDVRWTPDEHHQQILGTLCWFLGDKAAQQDHWRFERMREVGQQ